MASITSLMSSSSSSTSSLYGNRNVISGLASGMDTEAMIENSISGYKTKITSLQQKMTKLQWKQDAYRSLITQMNSMLDKYMSYTSSTNLFSSSFFSKAVNAVANGANASKVAVTGKGSSDVQIDRIKQLAQAASYSVSADNLAKKGATTSKIEWNDVSESSKVSGSISFQLGGAADSSKGSRVSISFAEDEVYHDAKELAAAINEKLGDKTLGSSKANEVIRAVADDAGNITFEQLKGNDHFEITGVSGEGLSEIFDKVSADSDGKISSQKAVAEGDLVKKTKTEDYLAEQTINVTLDGKTKSIKLGDIITDSFKTKNEADKAGLFATGLQAKLDEAFGKGKVKVEADSSGALQFSGVKEGSTFKISGNDAVNKGLGLGEGGYSNVLQTGWTLERVLGESAFTEKTDEDGNTYKAATLTINGEDIELKSTDTIQNMMEKINASDANVTMKFSTLTGEFTLNSKETGAESKIEIGGDLGKALFNTPDDISKVTFNDAYNAFLRDGDSQEFEFEFNFGNRVETVSFNITNKSTIEDVVKTLNQSNGAANGGVFNYNRYTGQFEYTDKNGDTVAATIKNKDHPEFGEYKLKREYATGASYTAGQDAVFQVTVNGKQMELSRSSNDVDLDGYNVTLKGAFGYNADGTEDASAEPITFATNVDSDKIVDTIKDFVKDYNELVTAIRGAYTTEPLKDSSGNEYDPLSDDDQSSMSETAISNYETKAKTGLLYADSDLANLYSRLTSAVQGSGGLISELRSIGIDINYSSGLSTLSLDEDKLRSALESDPDKVKNAFTQTTSSGASTNGMMVNLRSTLQAYGSTSIGSPGILVQKAGSTLSSYSLNNNELNDQITALQEEIEKWQDRMSDRVDYYTNQFTQLELLINQMNSQSSMLAGLSGGM